MMHVSEKIRIINESSQMNEIPLTALPPVFNESYYFVSYSHLDYKEVLCDILQMEEKGISIWYDIGMHTGENWMDIAQMYISKLQCRGVIFYLSENFIHSKACNEELYYVLKETGKSFFSINLKTKEGDLLSGYEMAKLFLSKDDPSLSVYEEAFSSKHLYLSMEDKLEKKISEIERMKPEDVLKLSYDSWDGGHLSFELDQMIQNGLIKAKDGFLLSGSNESLLSSLDLSKAYESNGKTYHVIKIGNYAFSNYPKLKSVSLGDYVLEIGAGAFANVRKLTNVEFGNDNSGVGQGKVYVIKENAFEQCVSLKFDSLLARLICARAFRGCSSLESLVISSQRIGDSAFSHCDGLKTLFLHTWFEGPINPEDARNDLLMKILDTVLENMTHDLCKSEDEEKICDYAFSDNKSLEQVTVYGHTSFGEGVFAYDSSLKKISFETERKDDEKKEMKIPAKMFAHSGLEELKTKFRITSVGDDAFSQTKLKTFDFSLLSKIGNSAFSFALMENIDAKKVQRIGKMAFFSCSNLSIVHLGPSLYTIGDEAFGECTSLRELSIDTFQKLYFAGNKECFRNVKLHSLRVNCFENSLFFLKNGGKTGQIELSSQSVNPEVKQRLSEIGFFYQGNHDLMDVFKSADGTPIGDILSKNPIEGEPYQFEGRCDLMEYSLKAGKKLGKGAFKDCLSIKRISLLGTEDFPLENQKIFELVSLDLLFAITYNHYLFFRNNGGIAKQICFMPGHLSEEEKQELVEDGYHPLAVEEFNKVIMFERNVK